MSIPKALLAHLGVADPCLLFLLLGGNDTDHGDDSNKETVSLRGRGKWLLTVWKALD